MEHCHPEVLHKARPHPKDDVHQEDMHWHCPLCRLPYYGPGKSYGCQCDKPPSGPGARRNLV